MYQDAQEQFEVLIAAQDVPEKKTKGLMLNAGIRNLLWVETFDPIASIWGGGGGVQLWEVSLCHLKKKRWVLVPCFLPLG